mgnify:CR=1 FL=1
MDNYSGNKEYNIYRDIRTEHISRIMDAVFTYVGYLHFQYDTNDTLSIYKANVWIFTYSRYFDIRYSNGYSTGIFSLWNDHFQ